jgi:Na+/melibiose symporter-like transporter
LRNIWIFQFGMVSCLLIIPLALIAGAVRGIPWFWQLIDISFGVFGIIPLMVCYRKIKRLEKMKAI